jgi:hypothetical protein
MSLEAKGIGNLFEETNRKIASINPKEYVKIEREVQIEIGHTMRILHSIKTGEYYGI